jgi:hypothetical protein
VPPEPGVLVPFPLAAAEESGMARSASPPVHRPPFWHRRRLFWVNALGFALTLFLGIWLLLVLFSSFLRDAQPLAFPIPLPFVLACALSQVATIVLGGIIVLGFAWRGADFTAHTPRLYLFFWTCAGLLFYLCAFVTLLKFGIVDLPNVARWAEDVYWGSAPLGIVAFGLMAYVNVEIPGVGEHLHDEHDEYDEYDEEHDDALLAGHEVEVDEPGAAR